MTVFKRLTDALADRYRLDRELGAGGMATVYLAHDLKHEREVAIKVLHPDLGAALGGERFLAEIKTTAKLQHPHILPLLDSGEADGLLYYVMPYVRGETLRARLERETQLPIADAIRIAGEVAGALQTAHDAGIVHRDIKPENILLQNGHALVADFGIALAVQQAGGQRMTQTGLSLGTPQYMSPEQAMGERTVDARSDIYALGAVTYEMLTGDAPFSGNSVQAIVARVLTERPGSIRAVRDTVSEGVEQAVLTALAKLPADRFVSAAQFAEALRQTTTRMESFARPPQTTVVRRSPWILTGGVAAIAAAAGWFGASQSSATVATTKSDPVIRMTVPIDSPYSLTSIGAELLPDGSGVVFIGDGPAGHGLLIKRFADTTYQFLSLADASVGQTPMPDGQAILSYVFTKSGHSRVMIVPLNGNPPRPWTDSVRYGIKVDDEGWLWGSHHSIDGLLRVSPDGNRTELLTRPDKSRQEVSHRFPLLLPGKRGAFFSIGTSDGKPLQIALYDAATKKVTRLGDGRPAAFVNDKYLLVMTDDNTLTAQRFDLDRMVLTGPVVPIMTGSTTRIGGTFGAQVTSSGDGGFFFRRGGTWSIGYADGNAAPLAAGVGERPLGFRLSPDGRIAAVSTFTGIDFYSRDGGIRRLSLTGVVSLSNFLPDGSGVVFTRGRDTEGYAGGAPVEVALADGATAPVLLKNGREPLAPVNSGGANGNFVAVGPTGVVMQNTYMKNQKGRGLAFLPKDGGESTVIGETGLGPEPSPDGRFVAWTRSVKLANGTRVIMVSALPPATGTWEIGPGNDPRWSADSRTLFFSESRLYYDQRPVTVMKVPVEPGTSFRFGAVSVASRPPATATTMWDVDRSTGKIVWLTSTARPEIVYVHNFARLVDSLVTQAGAGGR